MSKIKWYSLDNILKKQGQYYVILGERSNGKSYAMNKYMIDRFFQYGEEFAYVKRYEEDIKRKYMNEVFTPLQDYIRETYEHEIKFYQGKFLVYPMDTEGKLSQCRTIGTAFSLANVNRTKGTSYPNITTILFEEFMSIDCSYLPDELNLFLNLVSTIVRYRTNVKVFMLANTISKFSPYLSALGLKAHRLNKGEIVSKTYGDKKGFKTKFIIERTENVNVFDNEDNKNKVVYNVFGNSRVGSMITSGEFETHAYPHEIDGYVLDKNVGWIIDSKAFLSHKPVRNTIAFFSYAPNQCEQCNEFMEGSEIYTLPKGLYAEIYFQGTFYDNAFNVSNTIETFLNANELKAISDVYVLPIENHLLHNDPNKYINKVFLQVEKMQ